jgi:hypothetical protein
MQTQEEIIKSQITNYQAINNVIELAEKQISQVKDWQNNYPYMPLNKNQLEKIKEYEFSIAVLKDLKGLAHLME